MAVYCNECCEALCDFCMNFDSDKWVCMITGEYMMPHDYCKENFYCFKANKEEE